MTELEKIEIRKRRILNHSGHHEVVEESEPQCYQGSVAVEPYTEENPAAHGGVMYVQTCTCGATRRVLINGRHKEMGVWGLPRDLTVAEEEAQAEQRRRAPLREPALRLLRTGRLEVEGADPAKVRIERILVDPDEPRRGYSDVLVWVVIDGEGKEYRPERMVAASTCTDPVKRCWQIMQEAARLVLTGEDGGHDRVQMH